VYGFFMTKTAFVFPGQGSQAVGMLGDLSSEVSGTFAEASDVLGYDLWSLVSEGPEEQLNQTEFTQPALLTASVALYRLATERGIPTPNVVAGHSLGEYSALVAADVLTFADAVSLVRQRGRFMQTAVPVGEGGMAAVLGLDGEKVAEICREVSGDSVVQAANYNAPGQVVIAGANAALQRAIDACKAAGAKRAMALSVSAPFHSALMKPAAEKMSKSLDQVTFNTPSIRIVQNIDAAFHSNPRSIKQNLVLQMYGAVLWADSVNAMKADGVELMVECGPGKVLSGLAKRIDKSLPSLNIGNLDSLQATAETLGQ
jgi:[acyl-carrier-protein] S-malonyltransferase